MASNGFQISLLAMLAFLPLAGLALLSPEQIQSQERREFFLAALLLARCLTPPVAALIVAYLARKDGLLDSRSSLGVVFRQNALPSIGLVLGVAVFGSVASLFLVIPGIAFWLASCVVLPVLVVEKLSSPMAVKRSWELTREHRGGLLQFWSGYGVLACMLVAMVGFATSSIRVSDLSEPLPWVQHDSFLPLVLLGSVLYAGMVCACYEVYRQLVPPEEPAP